jgi:hypothetical protein
MVSGRVVSWRKEAGKRRKGNRKSPDEIASLRSAFHRASGR